MPAHPTAQALLKCCEVPIAAPSANLSGQLSPTRLEHAKSHFNGNVTASLEGGPCAVGIESTIIGWKGDRAVLLRPGGIATHLIEEVLGHECLYPPPTDQPLAPGMLLCHYAPRTKLLFVERDEIPALEGRWGLLCLKRNGNSRLFSHIEELSPTGDLRVAAANLFAALHRLDALELDGILTSGVPAEGLGIAINDRLRRASH